MAKIKRTVDGLAVVTPYDAAFLIALKRLVPNSERRWRKPAWIVDPKHESQMIALVKQYFGNCELLAEPSKESAGGLVHIETRRLRVEYIGSCKQRESGESSAFGWANGDWNVIFLESALREYFKDGSATTTSRNESTLYGLLGIENTATPEQVKSAYRRAARQWHPDVNSDPDAAQVFRRLSNAYQILSDTKTRKRYDAGLALEGNKSNDAFGILTSLQSTYRAPYTCGLIRFKGKRSLGRWVVESIIEWDDIKNEQGQVMVSSWDKLANTFKVSWTSGDYEIEVEI